MPGGGRLVIETSEVVVGDEMCRANPAARPGRFVRLAVSDTGAGMTDEEKAKAFEPFFTTKAKGTGLGLPMVYGAVSQHNGFIVLTSEVGRGTTVEVFLPATADAEDERPSSDTAGSATGAETIFLVEDERLVRELTERALCRLGYRVLTFSDGAAALAAAESFAGAIHLLLTDVVMPGMNGRELASRLAEIRPRPGRSSRPGTRPTSCSATACSNRGSTSSPSPTRHTPSPRKCVPFSTRDRGLASVRRAIGRRWPPVARRGADARGRLSPRRPACIIP